jgi:hypothetical protein
LIPLSMPAAPAWRGRPLTAVERGRYAPFFDAVLLASVRVFDGRAPFWLRPDMLGVTLGAAIYFRPGVYDPERRESVELLAHELVHVRQYAEGMTIFKYARASLRGYWLNPYEVEARALAAQMTPSIERASASATSIPSTPADMIPPA